jgi:hypothetical protein
VICWFCSSGMTSGDRVANLVPHRLGVLRAVCTRQPERRGGARRTAPLHDAAGDRLCSPRRGERKPAAATGDARGASYGSCRASARQALGRRGVRWRSTDTNVTAIDRIGHLTPHRAARVFVEAAAGRERTRIHTHIDVTPSSGCVDARQVCAVPRQAVPSLTRNETLSDRGARS